MGETDTMVMHSVVDILGLHPISRAIFDNAAAAVVGMARDGGGAVGELGERTVGVTMLGQTTPGVMRLRERLLAAGHAPVDLPRQRRRRPGDGEARRRAARSPASSTTRSPSSPTR